MIAHVTLPVSDYARAKEFYTAVLQPLGYTNTKDFPPEAAGFFDGDDTDFWIVENKRVVPIHLAFAATDAEEVQDFYEAALKAGARDNGGPGYRTEYWPGYYAAFVHDLDGHNIEVVWYDYSKDNG